MPSRRSICILIGIALGDVTPVGGCSLLVQRRISAAKQMTATRRLQMEQNKQMEQIRRRFIRETEEGLDVLAKSPDLKEEWRRLWSTLDRPKSALPHPHQYPAQINPPRPAA